MLKFYQLSASLFIGMVVITCLIIFLGVHFSRVSSPLLPQKSSKLPWKHGLEPKTFEGKTSLEVIEESDVVDYQFFLSSDEPFPYTSYAFNFSDTEKLEDLVDLRRFDSVTFDVSCAPKNVFLFVLFTYDSKSTVLSDNSTYRVSSTFFTCDESLQSVSVSLKKLDTPDWWLQQNGYKFTDRGYRLDQVYSFAIVNSMQSPRAVSSSVHLSSVTLRGVNANYTYIAITAVVFAWFVFLVWFVRRYIYELISQVKEKMKQDRPFIAYQKISISKVKDDFISGLLRFMSTEYSDPDVNIDIAAGKLGVSRAKINEVLKSELDLTFTAYVSKLRLTESARLLANETEMNIAQIAYAVGFKNVTYFNKLFKNEYGCTPKMFKNNNKLGNLPCS